MSLPFIYDSLCPDGMKLMYVGDDPEHANRIGTSLDEYAELVGGQPNESAIPDGAEIIDRRRFILEDLNRGSGETVIGGATLAVVSREVDDGMEGVGFHLTSAMVIEPYRRRQIGNYIVGRLIGDMLVRYSAKNLIIHGVNFLGQDMRRTLGEKGFRAVEGADDAFSINLPGMNRWLPYGAKAASVKKEISDKKWSGILNDRIVYRNGEVVGYIGYVNEGDEDEDAWGIDELKIFDADGKVVHILETDNPDINWTLTAAMILVNRENLNLKHE